MPNLRVKEIISKFVACVTNSQLLHNIDRHIAYLSCQGKDTRFDHAYDEETEDVLFFVCFGDLLCPGSAATDDVCRHIYRRGQQRNLLLPFQSRNRRGYAIGLTVSEKSIISDHQPWWWSGYSGISSWHEDRHSDWYSSRYSCQQGSMCSIQMNAVIAITSDVGDLQGELNFVWNNILPIL